MTYEMFFDGNVLISQDLLYALPFMIRALVLTILVVVFTILSFIYINYYFDDLEKRLERLTRGNKA